VIQASRELLAPRADVWAVVSEPYNFPDWWPAYTGVQPDRRGLAPGARWTVSRGRSPGLLRRPGGESVIVITDVEEGLELGWEDVQQQIRASIVLANAGSDRTLATITVDGPPWRLLAEGARGLPKRALARLHELCQTAASL
jgi:Polyketide cyclase / dehydrase and lipid transport